MINCPFSACSESSAREESLIHKEMNMSELAEALANLKDEAFLSLVRKELEAGTSPMEIIAKCRVGMDIVGERYKAGDFFLSELIVSGELFKEAMALIEPHLRAQAEGEKLVKIVLGTVKGDIHNIGKDIVAVLFKGAGFDVHDLGIDVPPRTFVDQLKQTGAQILALSGLMTPSFTSMKETIDEINEAGLRNKVRVIIGGGVVTEMVLRHTGADAFTTDGVEGVEICRRFVEEFSRT
jgi:5-methyltetrahydrofolate--homocysteine methyltransferase